MALKATRLSPATMTTRTQSWAAVEEKLQMDIAIWKSKAVPESRSAEYMDLVEGTWIKLIDRGVVTLSIGKLEWELTPPSGYMGYCEKQDDWLLVSGSGFRVALRSPHGSAALQVCPCSDKIDVDDKLNDMLTQFFSSEETGTSASPILRRTVSQKKRAEIVGKKFGAPFVRCVNDLQNAIDISDVLDTVLGFSAAYVSNQQVLQQVPEESDFEDSYFYDKEVMEEERRLYAKRRNDSLWVREQVRDAVMKCQAAAEATSEVTKLGAGMLLNMLESTTYNISIQGKYASRIFQRGNGEETHNPKVVKNLGDAETDELIELNPNSSSELHLGNQLNSMSGPSSNFKDHLASLLSASRQDWNSDNPESGAANPKGSSLENGPNEIGDSEEGNNPLGAMLRIISFGSGWQSDMGNDTCSESSWELVRGSKTNDSTNDMEDEDDVLGTGISDAESLDMMLRDRDPCGSNDCSHLINDFLSLNLSSASSTDQEKNVDEQETRRSGVLKRLASWSSSNSGWSSSTERDISASSVSKKIRTVQLETLTEEPACDSETARACRSFVLSAAAAGNVLQWCSCKFNKSRSSIELRFQVGSFMEDDIATLSTGISSAAPLRIEIFLDPTNVRRSLLEGNVRISTDQPGVPNEGTPPVVGLSCYIPHLVRQYLKHSIREQSSSGHEFPDGELLTGLMKHVVAKLVFIKHSCCVCNHQAHPDMITSIIPRPCEQNLCQALHDMWLVVAPQMVLELSTVEFCLRTIFKEGDLSDEELMLQYMDQPVERWVRSSNYEWKLSMVVKWVADTIVKGSWLKLISYSEVKTAEELQYRADLKAIQRRNNRTEIGRNKTPGVNPCER